MYRKRIPRSDSVFRHLCAFSTVGGGSHRSCQRLVAPFKERPRLDQPLLGLESPLWLGLTKKMILGDNLVHPRCSALFRRRQFPSCTLETIGVMWAANFQVYCDFSGYPDGLILRRLLLVSICRKILDCPFQLRTLMEHWRRCTSLYRLKDSSLHSTGRFASVVSYANQSRADLLIGGIWHGADGRFLFFGASQRAFCYGVALILKNNVLNPKLASPSKFS